MTGMFACMRCFVLDLLHPQNLKFRVYDGFGLDAASAATVSRNCNTNARIKFIFDTAIDDLEWKNPVDFGDNRKKTKWPLFGLLDFNVSLSQ